MNEKGIVLLTVIIIAVMLFAISGSFLIIGTKARYLNERYYENVVALSLAEAGVDIAMHEINYGNCDFSGWTAMGGAKRLSVNSFDDGLGNVYGTIVVDAENPTGLPHIKSSGIVSSVNGPDVTRTVEAVLDEHRLFEYAMLSDINITLNGTPYVDSYDSSLGEYNEDIAGVPNLYQNGDVVTNGEGDPAITLTGSATIYGDAATGEEGTIYMDGTTNITGDVSNQADEYMPPVVVPQDCIDAALEPSITSDTVLDAAADGQHHKFSSIDMASKDTLTLSGNLDIYITGNITTAAQAIIIIQAGSIVNIYFDGDVDLAGKGVLNVDKIPNQLTFWGTSATNINIAGVGEFYGTFYAPNANIFSISGNSELFGAVVAQNILHDGTAGFHYDESLKDSGPTMGYDVIGWNEVN